MYPTKFITIYSYYYVTLHIPLSNNSMFSPLHSVHASIQHQINLLPNACTEYIRASYPLTQTFLPGMHKMAKVKIKSCVQGVHVGVGNKGLGIIYKAMHSCCRYCR